MQSYKIPKYWAFSGLLAHCVKLSTSVYFYLVDVKWWSERNIMTIAE